MTLEALADFNIQAFRPIIHEFWRAWFIGASNSDEGRELGNPSREYWADPSELPYWIGLNEAEARPSYMSVAIFQERDRPRAIDCLFYDFDSGEGDLEAAWSDAQEFSRTLRRRYGCEPLIAYSGRKGFHVYVFIEKPYRGSCLREVYAELQAMTLRGLKLQTLDTAVLGDVKRLSRIPYTRHEKSRHLCYPVDEKRRPLLVDAESLWALRHRGLPADLIKLALERVEERLEAEGEKARRLKYRPYYPREWDGKPRPCIERALKLPLDGERGHMMRLAILREYQALGWSKRFIAQLYRFQSDYRDGSRALRIVEANWRRDVKPFRCETIMELGFCLGPKCPIYRRRMR